MDNAFEEALSLNHRRRSAVTRVPKSISYRLWPIIEQPVESQKQPYWRKEEVQTLRHTLLEPSYVHADMHCMVAYTASG